jgi:hypothetical protein
MKDLLYHNLSDGSKLPCQTIKRLQFVTSFHDFNFGYCQVTHPFRNGETSGTAEPWYLIARRVNAWTRPRRRRCESRSDGIDFALANELHQDSRRHANTTAPPFRSIRFEKISLRRVPGVYAPGYQMPSLRDFGGRSKYSNRGGALDFRSKAFSERHEGVL